MAFDAEFLSLMQQTVTVTHTSTRDAYGKTTYSSTTSTSRCLIEAKAREVRTASGERVMTSYTLYCPPPAYIPRDLDARNQKATPTFELTDKITLPDSADDTVVHPIIAITKQYDEDGVHHQVVYI